MPACLALARAVRSGTDDDENGFNILEGLAESSTILDLLYGGSRSALGVFDWGMAGI